MSAEIKRALEVLASRFDLGDGGPNLISFDALRDEFYRRQEIAQHALTIQSKGVMMNNWQHISTAPKDGSRILILSPMKTIFMIFISMMSFSGLNLGSAGVRATAAGETTDTLPIIQHTGCRSQSLPPPLQ